MPDAARVLKEIDIPFHFDTNGGGIAVTVDPVRQIVNHLREIVLTAYNERAMRPDYGSPTRSYLFGGTDATIMQELQTLLLASINQWEPNVVIQHIRPIPHNVSEGILELEIAFAIPPNTNVYTVLAAAGPAHP